MAWRTIEAWCRKVLSLCAGVGHAVKFVQYALLHLVGGLVSKGDGENAFETHGELVLAGRKGQEEVLAHEGVGLARTR